MSTATLDNTQDIIDVRDLIERFEELEVSDNRSEFTDEDQEFSRLEAILQDLKGNGGDEQWRGDWYPLTLIRDGYFADYAQELAEDCGMVNDNASWPNNCIDWHKAARELQMDYSTVEIDGVTYWYR